MKGITILSAVMILFISCGHSKKTDPAPGQSIIGNQDTTTEVPSFFPVTNYIKGQIIDIQRKGVNPLKYITAKDHTDSVWIKTEDFNKEFSDFLTPVIDTSNLTGLFIEKKFLDQTMDVYTFTYDPIKTLPDTFSLLRWDVYVDPHTNTVKRIYLVKRAGKGETRQLTWQANKWAKMVTITDDTSGHSSIEKEITLKWDFE